MVGGAVSSLLTGSKTNDIDVYLVSQHVDPQQLLQSIDALFTHVDQYWRYQSGFESAWVYRTNNCLTYYPVMRPRTHAPNRGRGRGGGPTNTYVKRRPQRALRMLQVNISHCFQHISEILHSVDLGSCAAAWNGGNRFYFTSMSKLAFKHGLNVVDLTRRRPQFEPRLAKYYARGFDIAFPQLEGDTHTEYAGFSVKRARGGHAYVAGGRPCMPVARSVAGTAPVYITFDRVVFRQDDNLHEKLKFATAASVPSSASMDAKECPPSSATQSDAKQDIDLSYQMVAYGDMDKISMTNLTTVRALEAGVFSGQTLCGFVPFEARMNYKEIQPTFDPEELIDALGECVLTGLHLDVRPLSPFLSEHDARQFLATVLTSQHPAGEAHAKELVALKQGFVEFFQERVSRHRFPEMTFNHAMKPFSVVPDSVWFFPLD